MNRERWKEKREPPSAAREREPIPQHQESHPSPSSFFFFSFFSLSPEQASREGRDPRIPQVRSTGTKGRDDRHLFLRAKSRRRRLRRPIAISTSSSQALHFEPPMPSPFCLFGLSTSHNLLHLSSSARLQGEIPNENGRRRRRRSLFPLLPKAARELRERESRSSFFASFAHLPLPSPILSFLLFLQLISTGASARNTSTRRSLRSRAWSPRARRSSTSAR